MFLLRLARMSELGRVLDVEGAENTSSSQWLESFTSLFLLVCTYRAIFRLAFNQKCSEIYYANACYHFLIQITLAFQHKHNEFKNT